MKRNEKSLGSIRYLEVYPAGTQLDLGGMLVTRQPDLQGGLPTRCRIVTSIDYSVGLNE